MCGARALGFFFSSLPSLLCSWNGNSNSWGGGSPGDGKEYSQTVLLSSVRITPFNDPNDVMVPDPTDLPDGCDGFYATSA